MSITQTSDYIGIYSIAQNKYSNLQIWIDTYEKEVLTDLLGCELYDLFIADLTGDPEVPVTQRFIDLFDPFCDDDCGIAYRSDGIKKMLIQFVYFYALRDQQRQNTIAGTTKADLELSSPAFYHTLVKAYNEGVTNYKVIQWFLCENNDVYPEEESQLLNYMTNL